MGDFKEDAQIISERLYEGKSVRVEDIPFLLGGYRTFGEVNCYPGMPGGHCHPIALFISLNSMKNAKGIGHLHFRKILACLVQHMHGSCRGITQVTVIITDSWDARTLAKWKHDIGQIKMQAHIELYIFAEGQVFELPI